MSRSNGLATDRTAITTLITKYDTLKDEYNDTATQSNDLYKVSTTALRRTTDIRKGSPFPIDPGARVVYNGGIWQKQKLSLFVKTVGQVTQSGRVNAKTVARGYTGRAVTCNNGQISRGS